MPLKNRTFPHRARSNGTRGREFHGCLNRSAPHRRLLIFRASAVVCGRPGACIPYIFRMGPPKLWREGPNVLILLASPTGFEPVLPP
jgi:hypothetical protein